MTASRAMARLFVWVVSAALLGSGDAVSGAATSGSASADRARELGEVRAALDREDFDQAIIVAQHAVAADPVCSECQHWLGKAYGLKARQASLVTRLALARQCRAAFERAVELDAANLDATLDLFQYHVQAPGVVGGSKKRAQQLVETIGKQSPARGHLAAGILLQAGKDDAGAEREFFAAFAADPGDRRVLSGLVGFLAAKKRFDEGLDLCRKVLEMHPESAGPYFQMARLEQQRGKDLGAAAGHIDQFLSKQPDPDGPTWADAHWRKGLILEQLGRSEDARREYRAALEVLPGHAGASRELRRLN